MAYLLLVPHHTFQHDLCVWNNKTEADRTWDSMIVHSCNAQSHLRANPNAGSFFQQANTLSSLTDLVAQCITDRIDTVPAPPPPVDQANAILPRETALLERLETLLSNSLHPLHLPPLPPPNCIDIVATRIRGLVAPPIRVTIAGLMVLALTPALTATTRHLVIKFPPHLQTC